MSNKSRTISPSDVRHVAKLAWLKLKSGEVAKFSKQLSDIFAYVNQLGEIKTDRVPETSQTTNTTNRFREDRVDRTTMLSQEDALREAAQTHDGYFMIKAIFGADDGTS